ncbi:MAG: Nif3-like dinuclear metal center hexameric protein [Ruminococcus sp.]|nr:Nif3-like dinuclear metal center hexameric protein [Ruminococcus sp.]
MTKIIDILNYFETFAPLDTAMDFDNCGLLVGGKDAEVTKALVALDITPDVVREAESSGCELIISHHPVIFNPVKKLSPSSVPYLLAQTGIAAVCMHTNLDLGEEFGVNRCLAEAVGIIAPVKSERGECLMTGRLEKPLSAAEFAAAVKNALSCDGLRYTDCGKMIETAAVACGAGGSDIFAAAEEGADVLVTGEIKHHEINAANEAGVAVVDAGHFKSEDIVILPLIKRLRAQFPEITFTKSKTYSDNMKYL